MCLGQEDAANLRSVLRASEANDLLYAAIDEAISRKPKGHDFLIDRRHRRPGARPPHGRHRRVSAIVIHVRHPTCSCVQASSPLDWELPIKRRCTEVSASTIWQP
jgi:hypothetical protein